MIYYRIIIIAGLMLFSGCDYQTNTESEKFEYNVNIEISDESLMLSTYFSEIDAVFLESNDEAMIGNVDKIIYKNHKLYLLDRSNSKAIFVFTEDGKYFTKISAHGKGPGEFETPHDFIIHTDKEKIFVLEPNLQKIIEYDLNGMFIKETKISFNAFFFECINDNIFCFSTGNIGTRNIKKTKMFYADSSFNVIEGFIPLGAYENLSIFPYTVFTKNMDDVYYTPILENKVYKVLPSGPNPYLKINFGSKALDLELLNKRQAPMSKMNLIDEGDYAYNISNFIDTGGRFYFHYSYNRMNYLTIYEKKTRLCKTTSRLSNDINHIPFGPPLWSAGNKIISVVEPFAIKEYIKFLSANNLPNPMPKTFENLGEFSNPILLLAKEMEN